MELKSLAERARLEAQYADRHNIKALINSLSGGVDSTLSALITSVAAKQSRSTKSIGLNLPCSHDPKRQIDITDANRVAERMDMPLEVIDLTGLWDQVWTLLLPHLKAMAANADLELTEARLAWAQNNLKPTLRMLVGGVFADAFGGLTVGTDNASENALGYFSIRGDGIADRQPIRDMLKGEVQAAVAEAGFPAELAYRIPTPGLFDFQDHTDEGELDVTYADVDRFFDWILREEALMARQANRVTFTLLDECMTVAPGWSAVPTSVPCPIGEEAAARIVNHNRRTAYKRKATDLVETLRGRGLLGLPTREL
jgi:NAD+ synthase